MALKKTWRLLKRVFVRQPVEYAWRLRSWLDPRTHDPARRIKATTPGALTASSAHWMIFVFNSAKSVPSFLRSVFEGCARQQVNLAVVTNVNLSQPVRAYVLENSALLIERESVGRDFGAYKDALTIVGDRLDDSSHLILCNDSVYYDPCRIDDLLRWTLATPGFCAITESLKPVQHAQSFYVGFDSSVWSSAVFKAYWRDYLPIDTRDYAIGYGEIGLSQALRRGGFVAATMLNPSNLGEMLEGCTEPELNAALALLPRWVQRSVRGSDTAKLDGRLAKALIVDHPDTVKRRMVVRVTAREIESGNPISVAGFTAAYLLRLPILKRDVYFRGVYTLYEVEEALQAIRWKCGDEISEDIRVRGRIRDIKGAFRRYLFDTGVL